MATLAELMVRVGADISAFTRSMSQVDSTMKDTGSKLMNVGKSVGDAGSKMAKAVTLPVVGLATAVVATGAKFDAQMSRVQAISGATGSQFDALRKKAIDLGASSVFSSTQVGEAMENLASAGFNTNQILDATAGVLNLAASQGVSLAEASDVAASAINGFGLKASQANHVADVIAKTSAMTNANVTSMGYAFKYIAPVAHAMGISIEEASAAIGIMANAGIDGTTAGTTLRMGLLRLAKPTKEMSALMKETGSNFFDANGKMKSLSGIIDVVSKATANMTQKQKAAYLATMFGTESVSGFMALLQAGSGKLNQYSTALEHSDGSAQKMANTMNDNLMGAWNNLQGALESLAITISDLFKGDLQQLAGKIADLVNWMKNLSPTTQKVIVTIGLLAAAIAPLLIVIGMVANGIGALMTVLGAITAPIGIAIGVIAGLIAVFVLLWNNCQWFRDAVGQVFTYFQGLVQQAVGAVVAFVQSQLTKLTAFWNQNGAMILQAIHNVWDFIAPIIQVAMNIVLDIIKMAWNNVKGVIDGALNIIMGLIKVFAGLFTGNWSAMWDGVKQLFSGAVEFIWNLINLMFIGKLIKGFGELAKTLINLVKDQWDNIRLAFMYGKDAVVNVWNTIKTTLTNGWNALKTSVVNIAKAIWNGVKSAFNSMKSGISSIWNGIKSTATSVWNAIKGGIQGIVDGIKSGVTSAWNGVKSVTSSIFNGVKSTASSAWNGIKSTISGVYNGIKSGVSSAWDSIKSTTSSVFNSIRGTVSSVWNGIKDAITHPIQTAYNTVKGIINSIRSAFSTLHISIPHFALPHVTITIQHKKVGGISIPYPSFGVRWYAKGAIFNQATLLGGGTTGVGEAGAEAVLPIQHKRYMAPFASAVAENLADMKGSSDNQQVTNNFHFGQGAFVVREEADIHKIAQELLNLQKRKNRGGRN